MSADYFPDGVAMPTMQLFRLRLHKPRQFDFFPSSKSPSEVLVEAIEEKPFRRMKRGEWRIGNVHPIDQHGWYFKLGKVRSALKERIKDGDFQEEFGEESLSTHIVLDSLLEVCGIVSKPELANQDGLARQLKWLIQSSAACKSQMIDVEMEAVRDPQRFIDMLRTARRIESFRFVVTRPNMFDTEKLFVRPAEEFVREAGFDEANVFLKDPVGTEGGDLVALEPIIRNSAAIGKDVSARIVPADGGRPTVKHLNRNYVISDIGDADPKADAENVLHRVRQAYLEIRKPQDDRDQ